MQKIALDCDTFNDTLYFCAAEILTPACRLQVSVKCHNIYFTSCSSKLALLSQSPFSLIKPKVMPQIEKNIRYLGEFNITLESERERHDYNTGIAIHRDMPVLKHCKVSIIENLLQYLITFASRSASSPQILWKNADIYALGRFSVSSVKHEHA